MASTVSLKNSTLNTQANELALPEGSLKEAKNVVIDRDDTVQSRRGFKEYGGTTASAAKQLLVYKERILQHYGSSLRVDDGNGVFANISGSYPEVEAGLRIKGLEANSNFYFTTSTGIKKIVAQSASDLNASTVVETTGTPAGIDLEGTTNYNSDNPPFLTGDSAVAYRVVWGKKDGNDNLLLGAPSQRTVVTNSLLTQLNLDFDSITKLMDFFGYQGSLFSSVDYFSSYDSRERDVHGLTEALYNITTSGVVGLVQRMDDQVIGTAPGIVTGSSFTVTASQGNRYAIGDKIRLSGQTASSPGNRPRNFVFLVTNVVGDVLTLQTTTNLTSASYGSAGTPTIHKIKYSDVSQSTNIFTDISVSGTTGDATRIKVVFQTADKIAGYCVGDTITVSGATVATYNGSFVLDRVEYDIVNNKYEMEYYVSTNSSTDTNVCNVTLSTKFPTSMPEIPEISDALATNQELTQIKSVLQQIVLLLGSEPDAVISSTLKLNLKSIIIDAGATVDLKFGIPEGIDSTYFYQVYRSSIATLEGTVLTIADLAASDELRLAVENFPSAAELSAGYVNFEDFNPAEFVDQNQNLYTNPISGGGIADANETPPVATDLARFRDVIFYSNTKTKHTKTITLIGAAGMLKDIDAGINPTLTISDSTTSNTYTFRKGVAQIQQINTAPGVPGDGDYFFLYSANRPGISFRVYYTTTGITPAPIANTEFIIVDISTYAHTIGTVANATAAALSQYPSDFYVTNAGSVITIQQVVQGYVDAAGDSGGSGTTGFAFSTPSPYGVGERIQGGENTVKIEDNISSGITNDQTARSLCRIINQNPSEIVNAYYLSDGSTSPGIIQLKRRDLTDSPFYTTTNTEDTGNSFEPILSPYKLVAGMNAAINQVSVIGHGLSAGDKIIFSGNKSTPSLDGIQTVLSVSNTDNFIVNFDFTVAGTVFGAITKLADAEKSENLGAKNRVYYSKFQQPEAVPTINYFDVGPKDKAIKRIVALRDSLFIFKEEAVYRVGDTQPFFPTLFDSSVQVIGPDTIDVLNNQIYVFADSGINIISESGTSLASRNIYFDLTKAATYANNFTASFGVSYESDSAYLVFLCSRPDISVADICYRYNVITQAWTTFDRSQTCGIINNNKLYMGAGKKNTLHIERKDFSRKDFADEEIVIDIQGASISQSKIFFPTVSDFAVGDSVIQYQTVTQYEFNTLNNKLANDPGMPAGFDKVTASIGSNMNLKLIDLITELDATFSQTKTITAISTGTTPTITLSSSHTFSVGDKIKITGSNCTPSIDGIVTVLAVTGSNTFTIDRTVSPITVAGAAGTVSFNFIAAEVGTINSNDSFTTLQTNYNQLIDLLNKSGLLLYANYSQSVGDKEFEIKVNAINKSENSVSFTSMPQILNGAATLYKAISTSVIYAPTIMGDPISLKHVREAQLFTENRSFTSFMSKFSSDLSPSFESVTFSGVGPGTFGTVSFGQGYFGGGSNAAPLRTFIPRNKQRCRFIRVGFEHKSALEEWKVYGMSLTFESTGSTRAYR